MDENKKKIDSSNQIIYNIELDDLIHFNIFHFNNSPTFKKTKNSIKFGFPLFFIAIIFILPLNDFFTWISKILFGIIFFTLFVLLYPKILYHNLRKQTKKFLNEGENKGVLGRHHLSFSEQGIVEKTEYGEDKVTWRTINKIIADKNYIYIYKSSTMAYVIPQNAFMDIHTQRTFFNALIECWNRNKS